LDNIRLVANPGEQGAALDSADSVGLTATHPNHRQHWVDGSGYSAEDQNNADYAIATTFLKGCLGRTGLKHSAHVWVTRTDAVCALFLPQGGAPSATIWLDAPKTSDDDLTSDEERKKYAHCQINGLHASTENESDSAYVTKRDAIRLYFKEVLLPKLIKEKNLNLSLSSLNISIQKSSIDATARTYSEGSQLTLEIKYTVAATSQTWTFRHKFNISRGKVDGRILPRPR
jgi:hypothetical protein